MSETEKKNYQLVKVYIRQRPFAKNENRSSSIIRRMSSNEVTIRLGSSEKNYSFDQVFGEEASQADIYKTVVYPLIDYIISGYNCTVFAYGQTGSGKTHTIIGSDIVLTTDFNNDPSVGIIPRAASHLFSQLNSLNGKIEYTVTVSFIEIYNEEVHDLLLRDSGPLKIYDDPINKGSVNIKGLVEKTVCNTEEVYELLLIGTRERQTAETNLNRQSSRSHTVFTLLVHTCEITADGEEVIKTGKLHLTDLAGSENIQRSGAVDVRAREAGTINKSLLTLGKVIKALSQKQRHIPYRDSKLTRILQDSLGGNTKTCMIATFSPCGNAWDETVSTLDYANVARSVANCPKVNVNKKQVMVIKDLKNQVSKLRQELMAARTGEGFYMTHQSYNDMSLNISKQNERITNVIKEIQYLEECRRIKEQQYKEIKESFLKTKSYLDKIQQELEQKKLKESQNEYLLKYMYGRNEELNATAELLLNVCETSTKHQQIYHKKYENQCNSTVNNANEAENLCSTAVRCVKEIEDCSEHYTTNQKSYISDIKGTSKSLNECNLKNLKMLTDFISELQGHMKKYDLSFEQIVNCNSSEYSECNIPEKINSILDNSSEVERQREIMNSVELLKQVIVAKDEEFTSTSNNFLKLIDDECNEQKEYSVVFENLLQNLYENIEERRNNILKRINQNRHIRMLEEFLSIEEEKEEEMLKEMANIRKTTEQISLVLGKYEKSTLLTCAKEELLDMQACQRENANTQLRKIEATTTILENSENCSEGERVSKIEKLNQYVSGLFKTINENLKCYNMEIKNSFCALLEQVQTGTKNLRESTLKYSGHIKDVSKDVSNSTQTNNSDLKKFINLSSDTLQGFNKNVAFTAHRGDTPAKMTYDYPKTIVDRIPPEILIEQFMNSTGNSDSFS